LGKSVRLLDWGRVEQASRRLAGKVAKELRAKAGAFVAEYSKVRKGDVKKADFSDLDEELVVELRVAYEKAAVEMAEELGVDYVDVSEAAVAWAEEHAADVVGQMDEATARRLDELVADKMREGETSGEIADSISGSFEFSEERAQLIAEEA